MTWRDVVRSGGEIGRDLTRVDWAATSLGPPDTWPSRLFNDLRLMLASRFAMWLAWGPDLTFFCNEAYRRDTLGSKYPWALGRPASEVWGEIWDDISPRIESVLGDGVSTWDESLLLYLERSGYREETYHTFSYSPLVGDDGRSAGLLCVVAEDTDKVIAERRLRTLRDVAAELNGVAEQDDIFRRLTLTLERDRADLPFTLTYLHPSSDGGGPSGPARLVAATGLPGGLPGEVPVGADWPHPGPDGGVVTVGREGFPRWVRDQARALGDTMPHRALVLPLRTQPDLEPIGHFVAGLTPHRPADANLVSFVRLLTDQVDSALKSVRALEAVQLRADTLAELDRVKTRFFANISHEFRTPLTLILGPLERVRETMVADGHTELRADLEAMHANALRLSKLVTDVLDFSRLQAGKLEPERAPVDLAALTRELAEMFRSTVEQAGLTFEVRCDDVGHPRLDPSMWERIVLNLLSNALKFTFEGGITVRLDADGDQVRLAVSDTGVGIPEAELPLLFDRFHQVSRTRARSSEGTGIGLALVAELTGLHQGQVAVTSTVDVGSTFTVTIPRADPAARPEATRPDTTRPGVTPAAMLAEAARWASDTVATDLPNADTGEGSPAEGVVLVVDDNADMRSYLTRLLSPRYQVRTAVNGADALAQIRRQPPDLVLSDVMMPLVDGVELVRLIRGDPALVDVPVVLLTAAASSDATAEGLDVGADDYLVKPFTAENLLLRVGARLAVGHERRRRTALQELTGTVAACPSPEEVLAAVFPFVRTWLGAAATTLAVVDDVGGNVRLWHHPGYRGGVAERYRTGTTASPAPIFAPLRTDAPVVLTSLDEVAERFPDYLADSRAAGMSAFAAVPLRNAVEVVRGTIGLAWAEPRAVADHELDLLRTVGRIVTEAVERISASAREHRFLGEFQERLLEIDHRSRAAVVNVLYRPAEGASRAGGDWYDVITLADGSLGVTIGDVVGSGLLAAAAMSQIRSAARLATMSHADPAGALALLDAYTRRTPATRCASALVAQIDGDGRLRWSSAGHPPPLLVTATGTRFLHGGLRPLLGYGRDDDAEIPTPARAQLPPASTLLLFTDGLVERRGESIDVGLRRLADAAAANRHLSVGRLNEELLRALTPPGGLRDDVALVALRIPGRQRHQFVDSFPSDSSHLAPCRRRLRAWLEGHDLAPSTVDDLILAFGEVVANAVEHGNGNDGRRVVGVEASLRDGVFDVSVTDNGRWSPDSSRSQRQGRGRGFAIINAVARDLAVASGPIGTTVSFTLAVG